MIIFDGITTAKKREDQLKQQLEQLYTAGQPRLCIAAILFKEDKGSTLYTRLKKEAAERVGIEYRVFEFSLSDEPDLIIQKITELNADKSITGIIVQKPWRNTWVQQQTESFTNTQSERAAYTAWWQKLTQSIAVSKDVDGLHPETITAIKAGSWQEKGMVFPATARAVMTILEAAETELGECSGLHSIIGKSDLVGIPLYYELQRQGREVEILGSTELRQKQAAGVALTDAQVVITATGRSGLITGDMIAKDSVLIDVGEPRPDIDFESVGEKPAFITLVPGGVGPLTVVSLLENCFSLAKN